MQYKPLHNANTPIKNNLIRYSFKIYNDGLFDSFTVKYNNINDTNHVKKINRIVSVFLFIILCCYIIF